MNKQMYVYSFFYDDLEHIEQVDELLHIIAISMPPAQSVQHFAEVDADAGYLIVEFALSEEQMKHYKTPELFAKNAHYQKHMEVDVYDECRIYGNYTLEDKPYFYKNFSLIAKK